MNDEDRELKAEHRRPGTYNIIVNPSSFECLDEYKQCHWEHVMVEQSPSRSPTQGSEASRMIQRKECYIVGLQDPEVVILKRFEDSIQRVPAARACERRMSTTMIPSSPTSSLASSNHRLPKNNISNGLRSPEQHSNSDDMEVLLAYHYRNLVFSHLLHGQRHPSLIPEVTQEKCIFEQRASTFPPVGIHSCRCIWGCV